MIFFLIHLLLFQIILFLIRATVLTITFLGFIYKCFGKRLINPVSEMCSIHKVIMDLFCRTLHPFLFHMFWWKSKKPSYLWWSAWQWYEIFWVPLKTLIRPNAARRWNLCLSYKKKKIKCNPSRNICRSVCVCCVISMSESHGICRAQLLYSRADGAGQLIGYQRLLGFWLLMIIKAR